MMTDIPTYTVELIWADHPTQAQGRTSNGRPFYFRAGEGTWYVEIGPMDAMTWKLTWPEAPRVEIAGGIDPTNGAMIQADVLALLDDVFTTHTRVY